MMEKEKPVIDFALQGIKTEQFAIIEENYSPKKKIELNTTLQFKSAAQNKQIASILSFEFIQGKKVFLKIQVSCHFKIKENSWHSFIQESKLVVPKKFLAHIAMISTGTARGVLFAKTEATPFSKYVIPLLNVAKMINENAIFDMNVD